MTVLQCRLALNCCLKTNKKHAEKVLQKIKQIVLFLHDLFTQSLEQIILIYRRRNVHNYLKSCVMSTKHGT
jgi:hypothetical protein